MKTIISGCFSLALLTALLAPLTLMAEKPEPRTNSPIRGTGAAPDRTIAPRGLRSAALPVEADLEISIKISPQVLVLEGPGAWVTIHADLPYVLVDPSTVTLNGLTASLAFADDCGDLVAKFPQSEVEAIVEVPRATLLFEGLLRDGSSFAGLGVVRVKVFGKRSKNPCGE